MNWSQNIGSALILCLSTISVILQPLLSKFSFLINLVSRNSRSSFPPIIFICVSWHMFLLFCCVHDHCHYCHCFLFFFFLGPMLAMSQSSSAFAQSVFRGDGMGFTNWSLVSTIMLSVCSSLVNFFFFDLSFSLCHVNPTQAPYLCKLCYFFFLCVGKFPQY